VQRPSLTLAHCTNAVRKFAQQTPKAKTKKQTKKAADIMSAAFPDE
jgi:hypothetical protein